MKLKLSLAISAAALLFLGGGALFTTADAGAARPSAQQGAAPKAAKPEPAPAPAQAAPIKVSEIAEDGLKGVREASAKAGRVLLVNFWATWCAPCREEFPDLVRLREHYPPQHLDLVLVSLDDLSDISTTVPEFLALMKAGGMPSYLLNSQDPDAAINLFDPEWRGELPATFVYDPAGTLAYKHRGRIKPQEVRAAIDAALGPVARP
ncbi:MAG TPA: TlpA disulfide reductase family protein [Pyrinomonadaceae bacterium]|nr:TlpA disulfide reductase family protein [Pyrinomonadaceae bacterium]